MVIDTTALVAILLMESNADVFIKEPLLCKGNDFPKTDAILVKLPTSGRAH
jgi:uncharacterized protein with PIN domain